jgi:hypothetical protein
MFGFPQQQQQPAPFAQQQQQPYYGPPQQQQQPFLMQQAQPPTGFGQAAAPQPQQFMQQQAFGQPQQQQQLPQQTFGQQPQQQQQPMQQQMTQQQMMPQIMPGSTEQAELLYKAVHRYIDLYLNQRLPLLQLPQEQFQAIKLSSIERDLDILDQAIVEMMPAAGHLVQARTVSGQNLLMLAAIFGWDDMFNVLNRDLLPSTDANGNTVFHYMSNGDDSQADQIQNWFFRLKHGMELKLLYNLVRGQNAQQMRSIDISRKNVGIQNTFELIFEDDATGEYTEDQTEIAKVDWPALLQYRMGKYGPPRILNIRQISGIGTQYLLHWPGYVRWADWWLPEQIYMEHCMPPERRFATAPMPLAGSINPSIVSWSNHTPNLASEATIAPVQAESFTAAVYLSLQQYNAQIPWPNVPILSISPQSFEPASQQQIDMAKAQSSLGSVRPSGPLPPS